MEFPILSWDVLIVKQGQVLCLFFNNFFFFIDCSGGLALPMWKLLCILSGICIVHYSLKYVGLDTEIIFWYNLNLLCIFFQMWFTASELSRTAEIRYLASFFPKWSYSLVVKTYFIMGYPNSNFAFSWLSKESWTSISHFLRRLIEFAGIQMVGCSVISLTQTLLLKLL